jgi:hypothetical protein
MVQQIWWTQIYLWRIFLINPLIIWGQLPLADLAPIKFSQVELIIKIKLINNFLPYSNFDYIFF